MAVPIFTPRHTSFSHKTEKSPSPAGTNSLHAASPPAKSLGRERERERERERRVLGRGEGAFPQKGSLSPPRYHPIISA